MMRVYEYLVRVGEYSLQLPDRAEVLTVAMRGGAAYLYVRFDDALPKSARAFCLVQTGHDVSHCGRYVGSFPYLTGVKRTVEEMLHLFEGVFERESVVLDGACYCSEYQSSGLPCPDGTCPNAPRKHEPSCLRDGNCDCDNPAYREPRP